MLALLLLLAAPCLAGAPGAAPRGEPQLRHDQSTDTMLTLAGYTSEVHKVVTPDGYVLTMYRWERQEGGEPSAFPTGPWARGQSSSCSMDCWTARPPGQRPDALSHDMGLKHVL
jgi:hypothetical protein